MKTGKRLRFQLEQRLGAGWLGAVYRLVSEDGVERVIKFGHRPKFPAPEGADARWIPSLSWKIRGEATQLTQLRKVLPEIRKSRHFPAAFAWDPEGLPVVPILEVYETREWGALLTKPVLQGKPLNKIAEEYGTQLPPHMRESVGEIFDLVQAIHDRGGMSIDIRPENFVWIEAKEDLEKFGYTRPGFILYEMDTVPFQLPQYRADKTNFPDFAKEFETYLVAATALGKPVVKDWGGNGGLIYSPTDSGALERLLGWVRRNPVTRGQAAPPRAPVVALVHLKRSRDVAARRHLSGVTTWGRTVLLRPEGPARKSGFSGS